MTGIFEKVIVLTLFGSSRRLPPQLELYYIERKVLLRNEEFFSKSCNNLEWNFWDAVLPFFLPLFLSIFALHTDCTEVFIIFLRRMRMAKGRIFMKSISFMNKHSVREFRSERCSGSSSSLSLFINSLLY